MPDDFAIKLLPSDGTQLILSVFYPHFKPDKLFEYFTQSELLTQWWPQQAVAEPRVGGKYCFSWPGMNLRLSGEYLEFDPGRKLSFTWQWQHQPELTPRCVDIAFAMDGAGSRLTLTHSAYSESPEDQEDRQSHLDGWNYFLSELNRLA